jgi:hypothetical protein
LEISREIGAVLDALARTVEKNESKNDLAANLVRLDRAVSKKSVATASGGSNSQATELVFIQLAKAVVELRAMILALDTVAPDPAAH